MIDFETARRRVLTDVVPVPAERVAAAMALGRVLREPLVTPSPIPRFDTSAMDGYALCAKDCGPAVEIPVVGEARTGMVPAELQLGCAMRIFTGAALPLGADTVVMQERVRRQGDFVTLESAARVGDNVRRQGEDLSVGAEAVAAGCRVGPGTLMLAAALDQGQLVVSRRPRVTVLCTGDELRAVGSPGALGTIPESNSPGLRALAKLVGAQVTIAPLVVDTPNLLVEAVKQALESSDLLLTVGGVSVGDYDYVRSALEAVGVKLDFWKVAIKPGKPLAYGRLGPRRVLALPGNPASALVTFALFGVPLLRAMQGDSRPLPKAFSIPCAVAQCRHLDRLLVLTGNVIEQAGAGSFMPHRNQSSGATIALAASDGFAMMEPGESVCSEGTSLPFLPWSGL